MSGARQLAVHVDVHDADGNARSFGPGDELPAWAVEAITRDDVWAQPAVVTGASPTTAPDTGAESADNDDDTAATERPAQNAAKAVWEAYADSLGLDTDGLTKTDIIAAVEALDT